MGSKFLYVHVGAPKTATTFLQNVVFDAIPLHECVVKPVLNVNDRQIRFGELFNFSPLIWRTFEDDPFLADKQQAACSTIVSDEGVYGGMAPPSAWIPESTPVSTRPCEPYSVSSHIRELSTRISDWDYEQVRVILSTRRQDTKLASAYAQRSDRVQGAGQRSFEEWIHYLLHTTEGYYKDGGEKLEYATWYNELVRAIGEEHVLFLPFELLREERAHYLDQLLAFMGVEQTDAVTRTLSDSEKENQRSTSASRWAVREPIRTGPFLPAGRVLRALGLPMRLPLRWPDVQRDREIYLTKELTNEILSVYESGNQQLDERAPNLNLKRYGYY